MGVKVIGARLSSKRVEGIETSGSGTIDDALFSTGYNVDPVKQSEH